MDNELKHPLVAQEQVLWAPNGKMTLMPVSSSWWFQALIICPGSNWLIISGMLSGCHQDPSSLPGLVTLRSWRHELLSGHWSSTSISSQPAINPASQTPWCFLAEMINAWMREISMDKSIGYIQPSDPFHDFTSSSFTIKSKPFSSASPFDVRSEASPQMSAGTESLVTSSFGLIYQWGSPSRDGNSRVMLLGTNPLAIAIG